MAGVSLNLISVFSFLLFGIIEIFFFQYYTKYKFSTLKNFKNNITSVVNVINSNIHTNFILLWHFVSYIIFKIQNYRFFNNLIFFNIFFFFFLFFAIFFFFNSKNTLIKNLYSYQSIFLSLFLLVYVAIIVSDYISFLLIIETITTLYFFFFLKYSYNSTLTFNRYKNLISYYLWLSFFTLIFIVINLIQWVYLFGTLNFIELQYVAVSGKPIIFIILAFFWKLGVSGFHFFKLEVYKYLDVFPLLLFSTLSLVINTFLLIYLFFILSSLISYNIWIFIFIIICNILLLLQGLDKVYLFYFFAISSINTWAFFLIISIA